MRHVIATWGLCCLLLLALPAQAAPSVLHGNPNSRIYHNSGCKYFNCKACTVVFKSAEEARAKGFRACKVCRG